ncbi:MAG: MBL fold metallo-hydrolase [Fibrobacteraceae bacterium]|nr:MBL fold metallo-hydrolase [Fibrobacteraceae bacterium]
MKEAIYILIALLITGCSSIKNQPGIPVISVIKAPFAVPTHFADGHFYNIDTSTAPILDTILADSLVNSFRTKCVPLPIAKGNDSLWKNPDISTATWIGHASYYILSHNFGILTDPVFSDRISPVSFYGPKRATPPGRALDTLPKVDLVIISHSHYDHLDKSSIKKIHEKFPKAIFAIPLGLKELFEDWGIPSNEILECDWWESFEYQGWKITFVPGHHTSRRGAFDASVDISLWGGWVLEKSGEKMWFAGDIGMGDGSYYTQIAKIFHSFDVCFLPIGGYEPSRYTRVHISPRQAVQLHKLMNSKQSFAMHWGTFGGMTFEAPLDPPKDLAKALKDENIPQEKFLVPLTGDIVKIDF